MIVLSKYYNGDMPTKIHRHLNDAIGLRTIKQCYQMIHQSSSIKLLSPPGCPRFVRTKGNIQKVKHRLCRKKRISSQRLSMELGISDRSVRRIVKNDLELRSYKIVIEPLLSNDQKIKRTIFANRVRTNFRKENTMRILFSDEKFFDVDSVYNSQNDRVWAVDRADARSK